MSAQGHPSQLSKLVRVHRQTFHAQPALPVRHDAPGRIAQVGLWQAVVKHRTGADLLMRQNRTHTLFIEVGQERQEIECPPPGWVGGQVILCQSASSGQ